LAPSKDKARKIEKSVVYSITFPTLNCALTAKLHVHCFI